MEVRFTGLPQPGVSPKDLILALIRRIGTAGATGHVIEYTGEAIRAMSMEGRMTVCNMSIEAGARAGMIAPDGKTLAYLAGRPRGSGGQGVGACGARAGARCAATRTRASTGRSTLDASARAASGHLGHQSRHDDGHYRPGSRSRRGRARMPTGKPWQRALEYMELRPGTPLEGLTVDRVFLGSCTNARIEDLREAAQVVRGRRVASGVRAMVVPGSRQVKAAAEREGLDRVFTEAGFEWRNPGCSMCLGMNEDVLGPGERCASTSNRNFEGRQGRGGRTHLMSPAMAAAAAIAGCLVDVRAYAALTRRRPERGALTTLCVLSKAPERHLVT